MPETTIDVRGLYAALDGQRGARRLSWRDVASELDLSASTFTRLAQGHRPDVDTFATLLRWLGMEASDFMLPRAEAGSQEPMAAISSVLRASADIEPGQADALEQIFQAAYQNIVRR